MESRSHHGSPAGGGPGSAAAAVSAGLGLADYQTARLGSPRLVKIAPLDKGVVTRDWPRNRAASVTKRPHEKEINPNHVTSIRNKLRIIAEGEMNFACFLLQLIGLAMACKIITSCPMLFIFRNN